MTTPSTCKGILRRAINCFFSVQTWGFSQPGGREGGGFWSPALCSPLNVFHSPAPSSHQSFFRQISENVTVSLFAKHVLPYDFWAFEWKNSPFSPLFSSNRHFGQWLRSLTMSVMDVWKKNSRYLDNLRSDHGANSAPAMVREALLRKYSSSFGHCPFGGEGGV